MIAVCGLCGREVEVIPFERGEYFEDICLSCIHDITTRKELSVDDLTPREKQSLLQAAEIAAALMEDQ